MSPLCVYIHVLRSEIQYNELIGRRMRFGFEGEHVGEAVRDVPGCTVKTLG